MRPRPDPTCSVCSCLHRDCLLMAVSRCFGGQRRLSTTFLPTNPCCGKKSTSWMLWAELASFAMIEFAFGLFGAFCCSLHHRLYSVLACCRLQAYQCSQGTAKLLAFVHYRGGRDHFLAAQRGLFTRHRIGVAVPHCCQIHQSSSPVA